MNSTKILLCNNQIWLICKGLTDPQLFKSYNSQKITNIIFKLLNNSYNFYTLKLKNNPKK